MRIFLAGIMQGSHLAELLHNQDYRLRLRAVLRGHFPDASIYDPLADHADSLAYDAERGRSVFFAHNRLCREVDLLVAYVPQASMGTAIEMWETHTAGGVVLTISPLVHNWVVRFLSDAVYPDVEALEHALAAGEVAKLLASRRREGWRRKDELRQDDRVRSDCFVLTPHPSRSAHHASNPGTTSPCTSVRRKSRPWKR